MKRVYSYWTTGKRNGYSEAEITFSFDSIDDNEREEFGKERKSLNAAINDAKRAFRKNPDAYYSIYAHAILTDYYEDGTIAHKPYDDCARIGSINHNGEYFDLCESVEWLTEE